MNNKISPWSLCQNDTYPNGVRFSIDDERFFASKDTRGNFILFVQEEERIEVEEIIEDSFTGITLYQDRSIDGTRFIIKLDSSDLNEKFEVVCKAISEDSLHYQGVQLFNYINNELKSWSGFMRPKRTGLMHEEYTGLWGELYVVNEYYIKHFGPEDLMRNWTGVERTPQDLFVENFTLEVKATFSITPKNIHISSLEQLDSEAQHQAIAHLVLSKSSDGKSLQDYVDSIEEKLKDYPKQISKFRKTISELIGNATEEQLKQTNIVNKENCFHVVGDFPCLKRSKVNVAIQTASYKIGIHAIDKYRFSNGITEFFDNV